MSPRRRVVLNPHTSARMSRFLERARVATSRDASSSLASPASARARRPRARRAAASVKTVGASRQSDGAAARDARDATTRWLTDVIVGMNLCPFARASMTKTFAIEVVRGDDDGGGYGDVLARETRRLAACARDESATTLIVFANGWDDWDGFMRGPVREAEDACAATTDGETVTVVPFHPLATFDGESEASNYTSRSPFPTIHLLRACDIERAEDTWYRLEEREDIRERNAEYLEALGVNELRRLWARIVANDAPT